MVTIGSHDDIYLYIIRCLLKSDVWTVACFDFYGAGFHHYESFVLNQCHSVHPAGAK